MAKGNFAACLGVSLVYEGGWSDNKADPGGATMKGITLGTFRTFKPGATKTQLRNITQSDVEHIYGVGFWDPIRGNDLPFGVDMATLDYGINSGPSRAVKDLQRVVGAPVDGKMGPGTLKAVILADNKATIQKLCARRLTSMQGLKIWKTFKRGWSRRVADVEAKAVAMWLAHAGMPAPSRQSELNAEANKAQDQAQAQTKGAGGAAGGGVAAGGGNAAVSAEPNWWMIAGIAAVVVVVIAILVIKSRQHKDRAAAYKAAAATV
ncbi:glycosyl hydrolase 108 family protein [Mesorhizobium sp. VK22B]|uniref:Glycosyl hydrolase 108 family protein n=1 Tax=Mesorhizobium captivum TaxID=3072319 RepID=A0ABU4Z4M0_9HYPH|nr:glycosyl hydrolase 108 family protein [Mesorhizobium sp. VK22B]MDX8492952.1 glycosyl hydrolase 108 family protein [Mesorhizobium sp. VK22B]